MGLCPSGSPSVLGMEFEAEDDVVFAIFADTLQKHPSYLKSFVMHELNRLPSNSVASRLAQTSLLFAYLHLLASHSGIDIFLLFLEREDSMSCLQWPLRRASTPASLRRMFVAWTAWREFTILNDAPSVNLDDLATLVVQLRPHHLAQSWCVPPVTKCPTLISNSSYEDGNDILSDLMDHLARGTSLNAEHHRFLLTSFSSHPQLFFSNRVPLYCSHNSTASIVVVSCSTRSGASLDLRKSSMGPFYFSSNPIKIHRCRPYDEVIRIQNRSPLRTTVEIAAVSNQMFLGFSQRKKMLSTGETADIVMHMVGLVEGCSDGMLLITVDHGTNGRYTLLIPIRVDVSPDLAEELWEIELDHLVCDQNATLGEGSSSTVFPANYLGVPVACKEFKQVSAHFSALNSKEQMSYGRSFLHECSMLKLKDLHHPHILRYFGASRRLPQRIITERLECALSQWLQYHSGNDLKSRRMRLQVAVDVASGLLYLHERGLVHRDLKSPNILIDSASRAKIGDLGMAESVEQARQRDMQDRPIGRHSHSQPLSCRGSMPWMAPELRSSTEGRAILQGQPDVLFSADVYSYGVLLFEIWSGQCIMQHLSAPATGGARLRKSSSSDSFDSILDTTELRDGPVDSEIYSLIKICCSKFPHKRWTMKQVLNSLQSCLLKLLD
eukprot:TRINITY_DN484_c0_g1_i16.p1 TRINITY_DN484_c0_g1~~TRINITY_DN484_c0_g1_i16.p1  ORF type:complete len:666 (+),score=42.89 TRINITY_DN484_c0_g1_i16:1022-3019(+)